MTTVLVKRRAKRGRPRIAEAAKPQKEIGVYIARDPQGIKLFKAKPVMLKAGLWSGSLMPDTCVMDSRTFVMKFRNAVLPPRGTMLAAKLSIST